MRFYLFHLLWMLPVLSVHVILESWSFSDLLKIFPCWEKMPFLIGFANIFLICHLSWGIFVICFTYARIFFFLPILIFDYLSLQTDTHTCIHTQALSYLFLVVLSRIYLIWARYLSLVFPRWLPNYLNTFQSHFPAGSTCHLHLSLKSQVYVFGFLSTLHSLIYVFMQQDHNILIAEDFYDL